MSKETNINRICPLPEKQSFFLFGARGVGKSMLLEDNGTMLFCLKA